MTDSKDSGLTGGIDQLGLYGAGGLLEEDDRYDSLGDSSDTYEAARDYSGYDSALYGDANALLTIGAAPDDYQSGNTPEQVATNNYSSTETTETHSAGQIGHIGCGCSACCGDNGLVQDQSGDDFSGIVADDVVGGTDGKDALMSGYSWANDGTGLTLDFNFYTALPGFYSSVGAEYRTGFQAMNANQAATSREVLDIIETYANITFNEVSSSASADISFGQVARSNVNVVAHAWYPTGSSVDGDVFLNTAFWGYETNPNPGSIVYQTLLHEVGHALGLKHSFDGSDTLTAAEENNHYTVMSYTRIGGNAESMMMHDIAALQELYGVNTSYNTGNNSYTLRSGDLYTIWDAGGVDTLNGAAINSDMILRLADGSLSSVGGNENIGIAFNAVIENATGGSGNDTIYGNEVNNALVGNGGADTFHGSLGDDSINGGAGDDTVEYNYSVNAFAFNFINSVTVALNHLTEVFTDTLTNIENFIFADGTYTFETLESTFGGGSGGGGGGETNDHAPVVTASNLTLDLDETILVSTVISASDADGNTLSYEVWDGGNSNSTGYFELDGQRLESGRGVSVTADEFTRLNLVGGDVNSTDKMWVRVSDGEHTTPWAKFTLTTQDSGSGSGGGGGEGGGGGGGGSNDHAPVVTVTGQTVDLDEVILASSFINATDADGNELTYEVWDGTAHGSSGYFELDGQQLATGRGVSVTADEFTRLNYVGGDMNIQDKMWVRVSDGEHTTAWAKFFMVTEDSGSGSGGGGGEGGGGGGGGTNDFAPVVTVTGQTVDLDEVILASSFINATDADGNELTYEVWDGTAHGSSGYFELDGQQLATGRGVSVTADEFTRLNYVGGDMNIQDKMWVRVSDGEHTTAWAKFFMVTEDSGSGSGGGGGEGGGGGGGGTNDFAPVVTANNLALSVDQTVLASSIIGATDADGDTISYDVWDGGVSSATAYFELDGQILATGRSVSVTADEFTRLNIVGGDVSSSDKMWVRALDGEHITPWVKFTVTTAPSSDIVELEDIIAFDNESQDALNEIAEGEQSVGDAEVIAGAGLGDTGASDVLDTDVNADVIV